MPRKKSYSLYEKVIRPCMDQVRSNETTHGRIVKTTFKTRYQTVFEYSDGYKFYVDRLGGCFGTDEVGMTTVWSNDGYTIDIDHNNDTNTVFFKITKDNQATTLFSIKETGEMVLGEHIEIDADGNLTWAAGDLAMAGGIVAAGNISVGAAKAFLVGTETVWHSGNDGVGSGLDADKLDGIEGSGYALAAKGVTNGDTHDHVGGDGAQIDHGGLAGLGDDDHTIYIKADGTRAFSGNQSMGNNQLTSASKVTFGSAAIAIEASGADLKIGY